VWLPAKGTDSKRIAPAQTSSIDVTARYWTQMRGVHERQRGLRDSGVNQTGDAASARRTGAADRVEALVREGVKVVFGFPDGAIMPAYDALFAVSHPPCAGAPRAGRRAHGRWLRARLR